MSLHGSRHQPLSLISGYFSDLLLSLTAWLKKMIQLDTPGPEILPSYLSPLGVLEILEILKSPRAGVLGSSVHLGAFMSPERWAGADLWPPLLTAAPRQSSQSSLLEPPLAVQGRTRVSEHLHMQEEVMRPAQTWRLHGSPTLQLVAP